MIYCLSSGAPLERFQEKWSRFSVRKRDQTKKLERYCDSVKDDNALGFVRHHTAPQVLRKFIAKTSRAFLVLFLVGLAGCEGASLPAPVIFSPPDSAPLPPGDRSKWIAPEHMQGGEPVRIALLLPLSSPSPQIQALARSMLNAAQLALFDQSNTALLLIPKDTLGTADGAARAAAQALDQGAEIILGPLFAPSVKATAELARTRNIPVIAFSTDRTVAGQEVYLLSFQPESELDAIARFATRRGLSRFASLIPYGAYGNRVDQAFDANITKYGGTIVQKEYYAREASAMFEPVKRLAQYAQRKSSIELEKQNLRKIDDEASRAALQRLEDSETWGEVGYEAVLLPEEGNLLRSLAPLLPYYDVDPRYVKFLGTGLWDNPEIAREPSLLGGWFAAPAPEARQAFTVNYQNAYGHEPSRIASLAYDAVMLAASLANAEPGSRFSANAITDPNGYFGVDGLFRFLPDGRTQRGLSIIEITKKGFKVIEPAPTSFEGFEF